MNNEIELDMWLLLKKASNDQDEISSFFILETGDKYYIYLSPKNDKNVDFICKDERGQTLIEWPAFYNEPNKKFELSLNPSFVANIDFFPVGSMFEDSVKNFLRKYNLEQGYGWGTQVQYKVPNFSKEEEKMFGASAEDIFDEENLDNNWLGSGGFREVYDLGNFVLKVAHDENSLYTAIKVNESEANHQIHKEFPELTVKTYKHDPNYAWIIQDKVEGLSTWDTAKILKYFNLVDEDFISISGTECEGRIEEVLREIISGVRDLNELKTKKMVEKGQAENFRRTQKNIYNKKIGKFHPKMLQLAKMVMRYNVDLQDFKASNFGETASGRIVIIDIGTHYSIGVL